MIYPHKLISFFTRTSSLLYAFSKALPDYNFTAFYLLLKGGSFYRFNYLVKL